MEQHDHTFVIDIGTRFVRGYLCRKIQPQQHDLPRLSIVESEIVEHETRAMRAGQIHDIEAVAKTVARIKAALEQRSGAVLAKVAVAVAGRNLVTCRGTAELRLSLSSIISGEDVRRLEHTAVQNALENASMDVEYHCVGYSPVAYRLDGEEISALTDHRAERVAVDVLVTLLPRPVLEAMFSVMGKVGLTIDYLTLEPIAALEVTVSEHLRSLNLVLVDIGAGTSDIAVTARGKVLAFGMVPLAGDMVTETLCNAYLIDFLEGERVKREITASADTESSITFKNIFSRDVGVSRKELLEKLRPPVRDLAERIAGEVHNILPSLKENAATENYAVILVGGGSLTPLLEEETARAFQMNRDYIGTRPVAFNRDVEDLSGKLSGPDAATGVGIGLLVMRRPGLTMMHLVINDRRVTVINADKDPSVLSALLAHGASLKQIYGRPGLAKMFTLNGEPRTIKGELPRPAVVEVNGQPVPLDTPVHEGDHIVYSPAVDGRDARGTIADFLMVPKIVFNGEERALPVRVAVDGTAASPEAAVEDGAIIDYSVSTGLENILAAFGINLAAADEQGVTLDIDGDYVTRKARNYALKINGEAVVCGQGIAVKENDRIEFEWTEPCLRLSEVVQSYPASGRDLAIKINGQEYRFAGSQGKLLVNGIDSDLNTRLKSGDIIRSVPGKDAEAVLVDIFRYVSINPQDQLGKRMKLLINGQESQYTSQLFDNAEVNVVFE